MTAERRTLTTDRRMIKRLNTTFFFYFFLQGLFFSYHCHLWPVRLECIQSVMPSLVGSTAVMPVAWLPLRDRFAQSSTCIRVTWPALSNFRQAVFLHDDFRWVIPVLALKSMCLIQSVLYSKCASLHHSLINPGTGPALVTKSELCRSKSKSKGV